MEEPGELSEEITTPSIVISIAVAEEGLKTAPFRLNRSSIELSLSR
jgi:hypothetical protein